VALVLHEQHPPHFAIVRSNAEAYGPLKTHRDGTASVYVNDPFGNVIEVVKSEGQPPTLRNPSLSSG
jgi:hypothetical protein